MDAAQLVERLSRALAKGGIDVVHPLALGWYNHSIPVEIGARIPARGSAGQSALALLVANSRAVWEPFLESCASDGLLQLDNPLEAYLQQRVCSGLANCAPGLQHRIYWSHRRTDDLEGGSEHVAFQRMAHHAGLAYLDEDSHLCLHPRFGPWFSLRCVIIFDDLEYCQPKPAELRNPLDNATRLYVRMAMHTAVHNTSRKFQVPEVDVEAAEAVLAEANIEPLLEDEEDEAEEDEVEQGQEQQRQQQGQGPVEGAVKGCPSSSARSTAGSVEVCCSGGSTPTASSGCSSPRAGWAGDEVRQAAEPAGPTEARLQTAASRLAASAAPAAAPMAVPAPAPATASTAAAGSSGSSGSGASSPPAQGSSGSPLAGSLGSNSSRRSSLEAEAKPSMRAVAQNWQAWVAVRDSPCPGHPMRYSEEQVTYHYTRDRSILVKALLRRNLGPNSPAMPATGLLDPSLQAYHAAAIAAQNQPEPSYPAAASAPAPAPSPITAA